MTAHELAAWVALALSLLEVAFIASVAVLCIRFWQKVEPSVTPLLTMFGAPAAATVTSTHTGTSSPAPPALEELEP